jgi:hypothetical protein
LPLSKYQEIRNYTLNFGPQHPAAHGVLRLILEIDGWGNAEEAKHQKICDLLTRDKVVICRRTITKYRKKLNLPSARHRKLFNIKFRTRINSANLITTLSVLTIFMLH